MRRSNWTRGEQRPVRKITAGKTYLCLKLWKRDREHYKDDEFKVLIASVNDKILVKKVYGDGTLNILTTQKHITENGPFKRESYVDVSFVVDEYDFREYCF